MRFLVIVAATVGIAACAVPADPREVLVPAFNAVNAAYALLPPPPIPAALRPPPAQPGHLTLSNFAYDRAHVEAIVTPYPDCELRGIASPELMQRVTRAADYRQWTKDYLGGE